MTNPIEELLTRRVDTIMPAKGGLISLLKSRKIRLYMGFDPSRPDMHIGHLVGLLQMKAFQDLGHEVIFLIGDFTGMVGDPTDKSATRPKLTHAEVLKNAETYKEQAGKILKFDGPNPVKIVFNADWLMKLGFADVMEIASNVTVQQFIERDMFQDRIKNDKPIFLHEFMYPLLQGYDSVHLEVDLEIGGRDQLFNLMMGRQLMKSIKNKEKYCLTTKLLTDGEGRKIGKTTGNAVNLFGDPNDLFGAIMSQTDSTIMPMFTLATTIPAEELPELEKLAANEPMKTKKRLAFEIVKLCQGEDKAVAAQAHFETMFQKKGTASNIPEINVGAVRELPLLNLLETLHLGDSNSDRKRAIRDGAVTINDLKMTDPNMTVTPKSGDIIKYGKHQFLKIKTN